MVEVRDLKSIFITISYICFVLIAMYSCGTNEEGYGPKIKVDTVLNVRTSEKIVFRATVTDEDNDSGLPTWHVRFVSIDGKQDDSRTRDFLDQMTGNIVTFSSSEAGTYFITVSVTDSMGHRADKVIPITVK